jgi:hypothetical protein
MSVPTFFVDYNIADLILETDQPISDFDSVQGCSQGVAALGSRLA